MNFRQLQITEIIEKEDGLNTILQIYKTSGRRSAKAL